MTDHSRRKHSAVIVDGLNQTPSRAMLRAVGFSDDDFKKPQVGIASTWSMVTPCNMHINTLADCAEKGANAAGGKGVVFNTITVSDGISMGTPGMRYSLVSREVICDSIETVVAGQGFDGIVTIGGCDKNMPGCVMAMLRLNRPSVFVYGGTIQPGAERRDIVSVFEAVGARAAGTIDDAELIAVEKTAIPGPGSCGGMYTANTMASAIEALGLSLPNSSAQEAISGDKRIDSERAGEAVVRLIEQDLKPLDIVTRQSFENAITVVIALGGSTNAVLHMLAMAHTANIPLSLDDFTEIGKRVPVLADVKPSGKYLMSELIAIGGIQPLMKMLLDQGLLHGDVLTVTGRWRKTLPRCPPIPPTKTSFVPSIIRSKPIVTSVFFTGTSRPRARWLKSQARKVSHSPGRHSVLTPKRQLKPPSSLERLKKGPSLSSVMRGPKGGRGCGRCCHRPVPSWAEGLVRTLL
jgi:dihydroxy-acid dehydratase